MKRLIIADDLTGACDSAIQFGRASASATVAFSARSLRAPIPPETDTLSVNAATRLLPAAKAAEKTAAIVAVLRDKRPELVFKKLDSVMRGNPGAEIEAIMSGFGFECAFVTPAWPDLDRVVIDGEMRVNGALATETGFANDPLSPVRENSVAKILASQTSAKIGNLSLADIRGSDLLKRVIDLLASGARLLVFDAGSASDLDRVVETAFSLPKPPLFAGSAGLASALAARFDSVQLSDTRPDPVRALFFICGSAHPATRAQIATLEKAGVPCITWTPEADKMALAQELAELLRKGSAILASPSQRFESGAAISPGVADTASHALDILADGLQPAPGLCVAGGETAGALFEKISDYMRLERELLPGFVQGRLADGPWQGARVVTKAGAFGGPDALVEIMKLMTGE